jgi:hypothetical protein
MSVATARHVSVHGAPRLRPRLQVSRLTHFGAQVHARLTHFGVLIFSVEKRWKKGGKLVESVENLPG